MERIFLLTTIFQNLFGLVFMLLGHAYFYTLKWEYLAMTLDQAASTIAGTLLLGSSIAFSSWLLRLLLLRLRSAAAS